MLSVCTIVGTRPELIRLSRIIPKLDEYCRHILIHTGQNFDYELNQVFFDDLQIRRPDRFLNAAGATSAQTIANVIKLSDDVLREVRPDACLILGDTNSALAAISAKRLKIPIFHMEAGNRCYDFRVPEEINRRIVDHISDVNLPYSQIAREYLLREGFPSDQIIVTGSPIREVLEHYAGSINNSDILERLSLKSRKFFLFSAHREENVDSAESLQKLRTILHTLGEKYQLPIIFSAHPRTRQRLSACELPLHSSVQIHRPFGYFDYVKLQQEAGVVISDSGTISEEASILGLRAINLRETHERPEASEEGAVIMTGLNAERVLLAIKVLLSPNNGANHQLATVADYLPTNVSEKVLRTLIGYTDFVRRRVWHGAGSPWS